MRRKPSLCPPLSPPLNWNHGRPILSLSSESVGPESRADRKRGRHSWITFGRLGPELMTIRKGRMHVGLRTGSIWCVILWAPKLSSLTTCLGFGRQTPSPAKANPVSEVPAKVVWYIRHSPVLIRPSTKSCQMCNYPVRNRRLFRRVQGNL